MSSNIPESWTELSIGQLMDKLQYGYTAKASEDISKTRFLRITDIQNKTVKWSIVPGCKISNEDFEKYKLKNGDFVFARTGSIEKAWMVHDVPQAVFASYLIRGKPLISDISPWLEKFIQSLNYLKQIGAVGLGIGRKNVNAQNLSKIQFPLPPLNEQKRIVTKIEALQTRSTAIKEELEAIKPLLNQFRQSVLAAAFRGDLTKDWREQNPDVEPAEVLLERIRVERRRRWEEAELEKMKAKGKVPKDDNWKTRYKEPEPINSDGLSELPDAWCWVSVEQFADIGTGATPLRKNTKYYDGGTIPWVTSGALNEIFIETAEEYITPVAINETNAKVFPKHTLLIAMYGEGKTRGKVSELLIEAATNQACAALILNGLARACHQLSQTTEEAR